MFISHNIVSSSLSSSSGWWRWWQWRWWPVVRREPPRPNGGGRPSRRPCTVIRVCYIYIYICINSRVLCYNIVIYIVFGRKLCASAPRPTHFVDILFFLLPRTRPVRGFCAAAAIVIRVATHTRTPNDRVHYIFFLEPRAVHNTHIPTFICVPAVRFPFRSTVSARLMMFTRRLRARSDFKRSCYTIGGVFFRSCTLRRKRTFIGRVTNDAAAATIVLFVRVSGNGTSYHCGETRE